MSKVEFYKETNFKDTEIGRIPKDWEVKRLGEVLHRRQGIVKGKKPVNSKFDKIYPYLNADYLRTGIASEYSGLDNNSLLVTEEDIVILWDGSNAGEIFKGKLGVVASTMAKLVFSENFKYNPKFIYYTFKHLLEPELKELTRGTGIPHVDKNVLLNFSLPLPPLPEQEAIAKVLSDFDELIEVIDRKIETLQRIKKGLMDVYFTRGVFEHKEFIYSEELEQEIPKDWEVKRLGEVVKDMYYGITAKATDKQTGLKMIRTTDIKDYCIDWNNLPYCEITERKKDIKKFIVRKGDILISRAGSVGISAIIDRKADNVIFGSYLIKLEPIKTYVQEDFLHFYFQSSFYWGYIKNTSAGSTLKNLNLETLRSIPLPLPPLPEQKAIAERLKAIDDHIENLRGQREHLEKIKKKFMELLLTGKVRVKSHEV